MMKLLLIIAPVYAYFNSIMTHWLEYSYFMILY